MNIQKIFGRQLTHNYYVAGLIGVLVTFASILPSIMSIYRNKTCEIREFIKLENKIWQMPLLYAVANILGVFIVNSFFPVRFRKYWALGMLMGLFYPTLGTFGNYAKIAYGIDNYTTLYTSAQLMYIPVYAIVIPLILYLIGAQ